MSDRELGLDHEKETKGVIASRRFVNWYNGSLDANMKTDELDLQSIKDLAIIGNGNIAADITRIMLKDPNALQTTDMPTSIAS
eukprot:CAMPEP_0116872638 /NCGR_PEP_ID=MMETSP0463-20121206/3437_1 /TAXON_ID=181622 /ORGANISM="Strombidinopsis sp, Strain SopsisLIS2011" /LENGTH=82 /DNA_ID=CAMNT_0004513157 /DNA_START=321 /DNA_END=569 /DNA_ORIENTATION=-